MEQPEEPDDVGEVDPAVRAVVEERERLVGRDPSVRPKKNVTSAKSFLPLPLTSPNRPPPSLYRAFRFDQGTAVPVKA